MGVGGVAGALPFVVCDGITATGFGAGFGAGFCVFAGGGVLTTGGGADMGGCCGITGGGDMRDGSSLIGTTESVSSFDMFRSSLPFSQGMF